MLIMRVGQLEQLQICRFIEKIIVYDKPELCERHGYNLKNFLKCDNYQKCNCLNLFVTEEYLTTLTTPFSVKIVEMYKLCDPCVKWEFDFNLLAVSHFSTRNFEKGKWKNADALFFAGAVESGNKLCQESVNHFSKRFLWLVLCH